MSALGPVARTLRIRGGYAAIFRHYQGQGWTDGLPIVPPTEDDVREFLRCTDRESREVVAVLPPRQGEATVERIAINAVMAGCRPEYMPVIITAVEALAADGAVEYVHYDQPVGPVMDVSHQAIEAQKAWAAGVTGA
ncbi:MAG: hypothetical protein ACREJE_03090, partial [Candidatus Rokuibacteriota bacterium]